jgi:anti-anti-sigma factor
VLTHHSSVTALAQLRLYTSFPWPGVARIAVIGEVDMASVPALSHKLLVTPVENNLVVLDVDLADTTFLDCAGINALLRARHAAASIGCLLYVSAPRPNVRRVLHLTGVLDHLTAPHRQVTPSPGLAIKLATMVTPLTVAAPPLLAAA